MKSTEVTKASSVKVVKLTKIKQWYIPFDGDSYKVLRDSGVPLVRFHENFLPTLQLLCDKRKIKGSLVPFKDSILNPFLDKVGSTFNKKEHCRAVIGPKTMTFETLKPEVFSNIKENVVPKLEDVLLAFFKRWGYKSRFVYSEHRGRLKLVVDYWFDSEELPIIPLEEPMAELPPIRWKLGMLRFTFRLGVKYIETQIEISQGGVFKPLHSSKCLYSQLSSVKPIITALMGVPNRDIHNFDNPAE